MFIILFFGSVVYAIVGCVQKDMQMIFQGLLLAGLFGISMTLQDIYYEFTEGIGRFAKSASESMKKYTEEMKEKMEQLNKKGSTSDNILNKQD